MKRGFVRWLIGLSAGALVLLLGLVGVGWFASGQVLFQTIQPLNEPEYQLSSYGFTPQTVQYTTSDGVTIDAWFVPGARRETVILVHGFRYDRTVMLPTMGVLNQAGFTVLAPTLRGAAASTPQRMTTLGFYERRDVLGAIEWARSRPEVDPERIALLGISMGAATVLLAGAEAPGIAAVVAESPFQDVSHLVGQTFEHFLGLPAFPFAPVTMVVGSIRSGIPFETISPQRAAGKVTSPLLVIHGLEDKVIAYTQGVEVYRAAGPARELWLSARSGHANAVNADPVEYRERVVAFLNRTLGGQPTAGAAR